jgi:hypothetical protein
LGVDRGDEEKPRERNFARRDRGGAGRAAGCARCEEGVVEREAVERGGAVRERLVDAREARRLLGGERRAGAEDRGGVVLDARGARGVRRKQHEEELEGEHGRHGGRGRSAMALQVASGRPLLAPKELQRLTTASGVSIESQ